uniref:7TM_GPCR_Srx domain-containing protein n=1 Tax=Caenorhabditis tropicalis TaxID=1561998 RepID=A0A1I7THF5_9PELO
MVDIDDLHTILFRFLLLSFSGSFFISLELNQTNGIPWKLFFITCLFTFLFFKRCEIVHEEGKINERGRIEKFKQLVVECRGFALVFSLFFLLITCNRPFNLSNTVAIGEIVLLLHFTTIVEVFIWILTLEVEKYTEKPIFLFYKPAILMGITSLLIVNIFTARGEIFCCCAVALYEIKSILQCWHAEVVMKKSTRITFFE